MNLIRVLIFIPTMICIFAAARYRYVKKKTEKGEEIRRFQPGTKAFIGILGFFVCSFLIFASAIVEERYIFFGKKRTQKMEDRFGISITEEIKLKKYTKLFQFQAGISYILEIEDVDDPSDFMENNCFGEIKTYTQNGYIYSDLNEYKPEKFKSSNYIDADEYYLYEYGERRYSAFFYIDGDKYRLRIKG